MDGILKVTPEKLISTANEFNGTGGQIRNLTQTMLDTVNSMNSIWQGEAATAYSQKFSSLEGGMKQMDNMIREHVTDLQEMAKRYQEAERKNMDDSNALQGNIIQ